MKKLLSIFLVSAGFLTGFCQQTKLLTAEKHNEYGLVYTLPKTAFRVEVVIAKETQIQGPFANYSKVFLQDKEVVTSDDVNYIIETIRVTPFGVPDNENKYLMQLKAGATTFIGVADDGMLLSINEEPENKVQENLTIVELEGTPTTGKEYLEFVNEDFISAISSYKKAQLLAEEIQEVREAKLSLTRGTAETMPTDGRQLEIMLASLEAQEKALMQAFTGNKWKEREVRSFTVLPEKAGQYAICRISQKEGLTNDKNQGVPLVFTVKDVVEAELPADSKGEEKKIPKDAVIYCVPGNAKINISFEERPLFEQNFQMSQFGMLFGLAPSIFTDKKEPSYAVFDPATGALKELGTLKP